MLMEQARSTEPADFATISLGAGDEWLTSRLFIAAAMMERMRGIKVFVFVDRSADSEHRFVATADVHRLRWQLARRQPWLETAYVQAQAQLFQYEPPASTISQVATTDNGALDPYRAQTLVQTCIGLLQRVSGITTGGKDGWIALDNGIEERADWVDRALLADLLSPGDFQTSVREEDGYPAKLSRSILRRHAAFVAVTGDHDQFIRLVDRRAYLDNLATQLGQEVT